MKRIVHFSLVGILALPTLVVAQGQEAARILTAVREALGGADRLDGVRSVSASGTSTQVLPDGTSREQRFELNFELPDKFVKKNVLASLNGMDISRSTGFNGTSLIEKVDTPPQVGGMVVLRAGPGSGGAAGDVSAEEEAAAEARLHLANRQEFARLALGMLAAAPASYPLEFTYVGEAESPDGKADVLDAAGADEFAVRLFVDQQTHLPLMLSWMDKEPLTMAAGGGPQTLTMGGPGHGSGMVVNRGVTRMSPEDEARIREEMDARLAEAEARRRVVEYRLFYSDYKAFDGVRLPTRIQRMVDGQPVEEIAFDAVTVNGTIDPKLFEPTGRSGR